VDVVGEGDEGVAGGAPRDGSREDVFAVLDEVRGVVLPVLSVEVGPDNVVAEGAHDVETGRAAREVRRTHVGRVLSDDAQESGLELRHLASDLGVAEGGQVGMAPAVGANLVALRDHPGDQGGLVRSIDVVGSPVLSVDEEGGFYTIFSQQVEKFGGVDIRAVIECKRNFARRGACGDDRACNIRQHPLRQIN